MTETKRMAEANTTSVMSKPQEKKNYINKLLAEGDKRSYNEIQADLELQIWADKFGSNLDKQKK